MFRPATMRRLSAVVLEREERVVLRELGRLGVLQLTRTVTGPDTAPVPPRDGSQEMARCERLLARVLELRQALELPAVAEEQVLVAMTLPQAGERLRSMEEQADVVLKRRQLVLQKGGESTAVCERVSSYRGVDLPLDQPHKFSFLHFVTGNLPPANQIGRAHV